MVNEADRGLWGIPGAREVFVLGHLDLLPTAKFKAAALLPRSSVVPAWRAAGRLGLFFGPRSADEQLLREFKWHDGGDGMRILSWGVWLESSSLGCPLTTPERGDTMRTCLAEDFEWLPVF